MNRKLRLFIICPFFARHRLKNGVVWKMQMLLIIPMEYGLRRPNRLTFFIQEKKKTNKKRHINYTWYNNNRLRNVPLEILLLVCSLAPKFVRYWRNCLAVLPIRKQISGYLKTNTSRTKEIIYVCNFWVFIQTFYLFIYLIH